MGILVAMLHNLYNSFFTIWCHTPADSMTATACWSYADKMFNKEYLFFVVDIVNTEFRQITLDIQGLKLWGKYSDSMVSWYNLGNHRLYINC